MDDLEPGDPGPIGTEQLVSEAGDGWAVWVLVACLGSILGVSLAIGALAQACE